MNPFAIDHATPLVTLDATGMEAKYSLAFQRAIQGFKAEVFPTKAHTYITINTENTMNTLLSGIGKRDEHVSLFGVRDAITTPIKAKPGNMAVLNDITHVVNPAMRDAIKMVLGLTEKHGQLLVVTYKTARIFIEDFIKKHFPEYVDYIGFGHFKALRGLNTFESLPAVLVIGTPRVPPQVLRRDLIAFHKDDHDLLDLSMTRTDQYYHMAPYRYSTLTLADIRPTVEDYVTELEAGEIQQVVGRIRGAVSDTDKYIYLMTARPALTWVSYTGPGSEKWQEGNEYEVDAHFIAAQAAHWYWYEGVRAAQYVDTYIAHNGFVPTIKELAEELGVSMYKARKIRSYWKAGQDE